MLKPWSCFERGELTGNTFNQIREPGGLLIAIGDRQDVDLDRHRGRGRQLVLAVSAEDRLRTYDDYLRVLDDLTRGPDRVFQLVAAHQPANPKTSERSSCDISPPIGETSRISTESVSTPVIT